MSDSSKAKWPEKLRAGDPLRICEGYYQCTVYGKERRGTVAVFYGSDEDMAKNRALAGGALPRMVALLKSLGDVGDMSLPEMERAAIAILRDINELPGEGTEG